MSLNIRFNPAEFRADQLTVQMINRIGKFEQLVIDFIILEQLFR